MVVTGVVTPRARVLLFVMAPRRSAIAGEQVLLRPFRRTDLSRVIVWRHDDELRRGALWSDAPFGRREALRWLRAVSDGVDPRRLTFAVELRASARLVGLTNLTRIDRRGGTAYFGVGIGEKDCWGRGLAHETLSLMLRRAVTLGLTVGPGSRPRVSCGVSCGGGRSAWTS